MTAPCPHPGAESTGGFARCRNYRHGCDWAWEYTDLAGQNEAMFERVMHEMECDIYPRGRHAWRG